MPTETWSQYAFNWGMFDGYMRGRSDVKPYQRALAELRNGFLLPQGPMTRRRGTKYFREVPNTLNEDQIINIRFRITGNEEYLLRVCPDGNIRIFDNHLLLRATIAHGYAASDIRSLRWVQAGNTMVFVHPDYWPRQLRNNGRAVAWVMADIRFNTLPFYRYNTGQTCKPNATTGAVTLELSGSDGYWNAGHPVTPGIRVKLNSGAATITGLQQNATGGTALSSAGTAANLYDGSNATVCSCGTGIDVWAGYAFASPTQIRVIGLNRDVAVGRVDLIFERADNDAFTTNLTPIGIATGVSLTPGTIVWIDVPNYVARTRFRVRTLTSATLRLRELTLNKGLVATATTTTNFANTNADPLWTEQAWSEAVGYPRSAAFYQNRLLFGGIGRRDIQAGVTRGDPSLVIARKTADFFNFDDTSVNDTFSYKFNVLSRKNDEIMNMKVTRNGLSVFTSEGEFDCKPNAAGAISPANLPNAFQQSADGSADVVIEEALGATLYVTKEYKTIKIYDYRFEKDAYVGDPTTIYRHDMFGPARKPRRLVILNRYRNTEATLLCVPTTDGRLMVCTVFRDSEANFFRGWAYWETERGEFKDVCVYNVDHGNGLGPVPTLVCLVRRVINSVEHLTLEAWAEYDNIYLDCYFQGTSGSPTDTWGGSPAFAAIYANSEVKVIRDGLVDATYEVDGSGFFRTNTTHSSVFAGLQYRTYGRSLVIPVGQINPKYKGNPVRFIKAYVDFYQTMDCYLNGDRLYFREMGANLLDAPLLRFTGTKEADIELVGDNDLNPYWEFHVDEPVPLTITGIRIKMSCSQ